MKIQDILKTAFNNPSKLYRIVLLKYARLVGNQPLMLRVLFREVFGYMPDLNNPRTFNEKMQWLKLHDHNPLYHTMVDKYAVKQYVSNLIGSEYIIPSLGVSDSFDNIDFESLPNQFVLKTISGGGGTGVVICRDKSKFDYGDAKYKLESSMKFDIYKKMGEWVYKGIKPRILIERYVDTNGDELLDYKFFCFNGKVKFFKVDFGRFTQHHANYYSKEGDLMPFGESAYLPDPNKQIDMPSNLDKMIRIAEKLSNGLPSLRIDLYNISGKIYFGELTFYPASGFGKIEPSDYDLLWGEMVDLPS